MVEMPSRQAASKPLAHRAADCGSARLQSGSAIEKRKGAASYAHGHANRRPRIKMCSGLEFRKLDRYFIWRNPDRGVLYNLFQADDTGHIGCGRTDLSHSCGECAGSASTYTDGVDRQVHRYCVKSHFLREHDKTGARSTRGVSRARHRAGKRQQDVHCAPSCRMCLSMIVSHAVSLAARRSEGATIVVGSGWRGSPIAKTDQRQSAVDSGSASPSNRDRDQP